MSQVLYYSNFCNHSKTLIQKLSTSRVKDDMHFVCIDKRRQQNNKTYILLENGQELLLPESVSKVPAMLNLGTQRVVFGDDIYNALKPKEEVIVKESTNNQMEPVSYSLSGGASQFGIFSDQFSFFDMDSNALSAKGEGGMRQMYNYIPLDAQEKIYTPDDENVKVSGDMTVERIQKMRDNDLNI
jgi:hypothetical protein